MLRFAFHLSLSSERFLAYYQGAIRDVVVRCRDGQTVQFPAALLRPFMTPAGVHGDFVLTCGDDHRGASLQRAQT
jgi:hypothetical protein